ncbi:MAG: ArsC family reductase [Aromatoleum sp.]|jgi:Spx/MgsR family transcriptional regulator|uniref:ArsC family reductase n=1 Tax=Aromatoleum sp. TaxID=2307007 RepID=UPI002895EDDE|nr:ArsC family reductase [Aromatoleum sp.]MDT3671182.1 ArsC family reductase [Aromatoleum sp.]
MTATIYGIKNCDTMKKTFAWFEANGVAYTFHDYRKSGISPELLARWCDKLGWQALVNTRGTTWRKLDPSQQAVADADEAVALMAAHTSLIRRPVVETTEGEILAGFDPTRLGALFGISGASA